MYYYATKETASFLRDNNDCIYLFGSCGGYSNFGDIIQLKNAVSFHKQVTKKEPVIVMFLEALEGRAHVKHLREWYDSQHFVFVTHKPWDASDSALYPLTTAMAGAQLHIYGGGFLNKYWGREMLEVVSSLLNDFKIHTYLFSGQQIEEAILPDLQRLFRAHAPEVVGLRDELSLKVLKKQLPEIKSEFSFDDVTEIFEQWAARRTPAKVKISNILRRDGILWHLNASGYVTDSKAALLDKVLTVKERYPRQSLVIAHAYNDRRRELFDSLQTLVDLENDFPYVSYRVVNLAQIALECQPHKNKIPTLRAYLGSLRFAITSSYHTAMLMSFFDVPVFLLAANEYYQQKQKGLGYGSDFDKYLADPSINLKNFSSERRARKEWMSRLPAYFKKAASSEVLSLTTPPRKELLPLVYRSY